MKRLVSFLLATACLTTGMFNISVDETSEYDGINTENSNHTGVILYETPGEILVDLQDGSSNYELEHLETILGANLEWFSPDTIDDGLAVAYVNNIKASVELLQNNTLVESVEPNITYSIQGLITSTSYPNDPLYEKQWHMSAMGADYAWHNSPQGKGVIVAVLDTGVSVLEDMDADRVLPGAVFTGERSVEDGHGHGTHVAGTIAQSTNNGIGVTGVAPQALILPVKVLTDEGYGSVAGIAAGIDWAADNGAQVINMSLGGGYSQAIETAVDKARARGVLVFAACGNDGRAECGYPGGLKNSIGVSSTGPTGELAYYSSYGKGVDISAPGGDKKFADGGVWQNTIVDGIPGYYDFQGTSMATPHAAGAAAVLFSTGMSADVVEKTLLSTADGDGFTPEFGNGKLNLQAALGSSGLSNWKSLSVPTFTAVLFTLLITWFGQSKLKFISLTAVTASVVAGGMWYLALVPDFGIPFIHTILSVLRSSPISWVSLVFPTFGTSPIWLSCVLPVAIAYVFGAYRQTRPFATGLLVGYAIYFTWGIASNGVVVAWLPELAGQIWLGLNAAFCTFLAVGFTGVEKVERERKS